MKRLLVNRGGMAKFLRQRKFFLFLPALVLPSIGVLFYLLGGGSNTLKAEGVNSNKGLNTSLPSANIKKENSWNKLQYYQQADQDSLKRTESIKNENSETFTSTAKPSKIDSNNQLVTGLKSDPPNSYSI